MTSVCAVEYEGRELAPSSRSVPHLYLLAMRYCHILIVRAECHTTNFLFEVEAMEHDTPTHVDEKRVPIFVRRDQQARVVRNGDASDVFSVFKRQSARGVTGTVLQHVSKAKTILKQSSNSLD